MGYTNWSDDAYSHLSARRAKADKKEIFTNTSKTDATMNPHGVTVRESRDSDAHPNSNSIIVAFDVTGSMGTIPEAFAREKLGGLMRMLVERNYIVDPQLLFAAVGDAYTDSSPFQIGQFESGLEMDMWLTRIFLEGGGGGQLHESYGLAHWFAAHHTAIDCFEKRGRKGYLFTMGDEKPWDLPAVHLEKVFGDKPGHDVFIDEAIKEAQQKYHVFHIVVAQGSHGRDPAVIGRWREALGERVLVLEDVNSVCELIAGTIGMCEGNTDVARFSRDLRAVGAADATVKAVEAALTPLSLSTGLVRADVDGALVPSASASGTTRL